MKTKLVVCKLVENEQKGPFLCAAPVEADLKENDKVMIDTYNGEVMANVKAIVDTDSSDNLYKFILCLSGDDASPYAPIAQPKELKQIKKKITFINY